MSTLRFREKRLVMPLELVHHTHVLQRNVMLAGRVRGAALSHLFPRQFTLVTPQRLYPVYLMWWKLSTPVREEDRLTLCGDKILLQGQEVIRLTNFHEHWIAFDA